MPATSHTWPDSPRLTDPQFQAISHAVADPRRFAILQQIAGASSLPCSALTKRCAITAATISHHTKVLAEADLIDVAREGRSARLTLRRDIWNAYLRQLAEL